MTAWSPVARVQSSAAGIWCGLPQDDREAVRWYRAAAAGGNPEAENNLGLMYRSGRGVEKNKAEAAKWHARAAQAMYVPAVFNLAAAFYNGDGVTVDDVRACALFELADKPGSALETAVDNL